MKVRITESGVHVPDVDGGEVAVPVGAEVTIKGDEIPASLVNKCVVIGKSSKKQMITNPADNGEGDEDDPNEKAVLIETAKALGIPATEQWKVATLKAKIEEAEAAKKE